jgi:acetyl/propionyl-CoA carboxylase alpha subunit
MGKHGTVASMTDSMAGVIQIGPGVFRVEDDGRAEIVYVAGTPGQRWAFWNGQVFHGSFGSERSPARRISAPGGVQAITAPMPATVLKVLIEPGATVKKGDTVLILEAMKMELPIRAFSDGTVVAVHCRERELVQPDTTLVELK